MDKTKITNHQVFAFTATSAYSGSAILVISSTIVGIAKQDAWISVLLALIFTILELFIILFLWSRYPGITYINIIKHVFGKLVGGILSGIFVLLCLASSAQVLWYMGNFVTTIAMPETPAFIIDLIFITVVVIALLYGLEPTMRANEIFFYLSSFLFILAILLVLPNAKIENLQPILEKGFVPIIKSSFILLCYIAFPNVILLMLYPNNAENTSKAKVAFIKGYYWGGFMIFISVIMPVLVIGSTLTANIQFPVYKLAMEINVGIIFTRLEFIVASVWMIALFIREILYTYAGVTGLAQLLGLKDHKKIILPLGLILLIMSQVTYPDAVYQGEWNRLVWPPLATTIGFIFPILLIITSLTKKQLFKDHAKGRMK